jgi:SAM-dependent methyltransferase
MSTATGYDYANGVLSKEYTTELDRLRALERACDPATLGVLAGLDVRPDWHCLEIGAGAGSVAYWLAEHCPDGRVVAADLDPRFVDTSRAANLEVAKCDITQERFPEATFDFIHARLVLTHLPQREEVLRNAASWLRPGGYLLLEELYVLPTEESHPALREVMKVMFDVIVVHGADLTWGRHVPSRMADAGLSELGLRTYPLAFGLRDAAEEMWRRSHRQVVPFSQEAGLVDETGAASITHAFEDPTAVDPTALIFSSWGRRPMR